MKTDWARALFAALKYRFSLDDDKAAEAEIIENIKKGIEFKGTNLWTLIFAILIASIGLNVNSTAVIIGAMLISPLMGPIMGVGLGAGIFDFSLIKSASKNLLIASAISLFTSTVYFLISPLHFAQSELLARTSPTIWDVLIAFFGGLAGIVASSRRRFNNIIPGVAIATALMPPLCTAGYGIATGQWPYFFGAFYLYIINSVFISISTFLIVRFLKFKARIFVDNDTSLKVRRWIGIIAFLTIAPSIYLAYRFVTHEIFRQNAGRLIAEELTEKGLTVIYKNVDAEKRRLDITLLEMNKVDSLKRVLNVKKDSYDLQGSNINLRAVGTQEKQELTLSELKEGVVENLFSKQEEQLNQLKISAEKQKHFEEKKNEVINEFYALYGQPAELIIEKTILHKSAGNDTILFVYIKKDRDFKIPNPQTMQNWLKTKFNIRTIKILER